MANKFAVANGNFNATSTWSDTPAGAPGATVPTTGDNAYANGKTVTITANATCAKISNEAENGATVGGGFTLNAGVTLTANVNCGATGTSCLTVSYNSPGASTVAGNVTGGSTTGGSGIFLSGTGTLTVNGSVTGGSVTAAYGINVNQGATLAITGSITGGSLGYAINVSNIPCTITISGSVTGGSGSSVYGINWTSTTGTISVTGNINGSTGVGFLVNSGTGTVTINGNIYGSSVTAGFVASGAAGIVNINGNVYGSDVSGGGAGANIQTSNGTVTVNGAVYAGRYANGMSVTNTAIVKITRVVGSTLGVSQSVGTVTVYGVSSSIYNANVYVEEIQYGNLGNSPTSGPIILTDKTSNVALFYRPSLTQKTLSDPAAVAGTLPAASDVRYGTTYNLGTTTGTLRVPAAGSVALGVLVDNTSGTAVLTPSAVWDALTSTMSTSGSIGERLKNASTVASTGQQLSDALTPI